MQQDKLKVLQLMLLLLSSYVTVAQVLVLQLWSLEEEIVAAEQIVLEAAVVYSSLFVLTSVP
jgi:hypothetical protein